MARQYIHIYTGSVTEGGTDGDQVSQSTMLTPIESAFLNATTAERGSWMVAAVRCEAGFKSDDVEISVTDYAHWEVAPYRDGQAIEDESGDSIVLSGVTDVNTLFAVRARATLDETPVEDPSNKLAVSATVKAI